MKKNMLLDIYKYFMGIKSLKQKQNQKLNNKYYKIIVILI